MVRLGAMSPGGTPPLPFIPVVAALCFSLSPARDGGREAWRRGKRDPGAAGWDGALLEGWGGGCSAGTQGGSGGLGPVPLLERPHPPVGSSTLPAKAGVRCRGALVQTVPFHTLFESRVMRMARRLGEAEDDQLWARCPAVSTQAGPIPFPPVPKRLTTCPAPPPPWMH